MNDEKMTYANAKIMEQLALMRQLIMEDEEKKLIDKFELLVRQTKRGFEVSVEVAPYRMRGGTVSPFFFSAVIGLASISSVSQILSPCFSGYRDYRIGMMPMVMLDIQKISSSMNLGF